VPRAVNTARRTVCSVRNSTDATSSQLSPPSASSSSMSRSVPSSVASAAATRAAASQQPRGDPVQPRLRALELRAVAAAQVKCGHEHLNRRVVVCRRAAAPADGTARALAAATAAIRVA
jgi:hypothetical protein